MALEVLIVVIVDLCKALHQILLEIAFVLY